MEATEPRSPQVGPGFGVRPPQRDQPPRSPLSPRGIATRSSRLGGSPKSGTGDGDREGQSQSATAGVGATSGGKWSAKMRLPASSTKPLVPATERISEERNQVSTRRMRADSSADDKFEIAPDGGSAGREGRQFTVANVGNNGRIYLRPTVRPANQRYPQPNFVFPITPPGTAGLDALTEKQKQKGASDLHLSQWTDTPPTPATPATVTSPLTSSSSRYFSAHAPRPSQHRRAHSDSTVHDGATSRNSEAEGFKIVISKPGDEKRAKTTEDLDAPQIPMLDIEIPNWKLGNPRFTARGTPFFRGSSYAPTDEFPSSSNVSVLHKSPTGDLVPRMPESTASRKPSPISIPQIRLPPLEPSRFADPLSPPPMTTPRLPAVRSTYMSTHLVIEPTMFDALTFKPTCDDKSIVRYSPATGAVTAATPPRLVAEFTSPSFLDYELISDFFLTYRTFLEAGDLLKLLMARLRWALGRNDEIGMVVRVRTFVAMRHWILNYFMDDFVVEYGLRVSFCNLLNDMFDEMATEPQGRKVQLKILAELKKCWRRVCAQFWDGPEFEPTLGPGVPIAPGGIAGHRNASLDPSFWEKEDAAPRLDGLFAPILEDQAKTSFRDDVSRAGHFEDSQAMGTRPATPENRHVQEIDRRQAASPTSIASMDIISCSFPGKTSRGHQHGNNYTLGAHPVVPANSTHPSTGLVATTPRALVGKRVRAGHGHKRNGSLTDSLREKEHAADRSGFQDTDFLMSLPFAGSLVRGNLMPPGQPYVEIMSPSLAGDFQRHTTIFQVPGQQRSASAMSGQGMKKLIGSVRRALSTRGQGVSPTQGNFINISPIGPRGATTNRLPGTAIVPQARPQHNGIRPPVRIDLLGAEIVEDFKKAVREDAAADAAIETERRGFMGPVAGALRNAVSREGLDYSATHLVSSFGSIPEDDILRPISDMAITTGSKSIVIVDDTIPFSLPTMHGALPASESIEAFADAFLPTGADPTPPNTPPGQAVGTPRRSSYLLNQHVVRQSISADPLPPFIPDLATLGNGGSVRPSMDSGRPFSELVEGTSSRPTFTRSVRKHLRQKSSRTNRSLDSAIIRRRTASFGSAFDPRSTVKSFDATTYTEGSVADENENDTLPQPQRVLRRRPGGDLRAVNNIGGLDALPLRKSRSTGSLTTYSESMRSSSLQSPNHDTSAFVDVVSSEFSHRDEADNFSLGAMAEPSSKRQVSFFSTHSSKPIMRPSFEAEAQKLAQIPDDDDDGGVESALLKLEGKYEKKTFKLSMEPSNTPIHDADASSKPDMEPEVLRSGKRENRRLHVLPGDAALDQEGEGSETHSSFLNIPRRSHTAASFLSNKSAGSYCSIPLLERGLTDDGRSKASVGGWTDMSVLQGPEDDISPAETPRPMYEGSSRDSSFEFVQRTESMERINPKAPPSEQSFLDDDSDEDDLHSDLSSELSTEMVEPEEFAMNQTQPLPNRNAHRSASILEFDRRPLRESTIGMSDGPPSPPMTLFQALQMSPEAALVPELHEDQVYQQKPLPPTPDTVLVARDQARSPSDPTGTKEALRGQPRYLEPERESSLRFSVHLPFTLAFDSEILAQQFTLIEKDALNEIDWKELIDMAWKNATNNDSRSWVDFLRNTDAHGVEVVIARFNIMVKWACSEIVLTQNIEERARCIIKFIHIAAHCRRYRNFATMSQITIALTSIEISRLSNTWAMVPPHDMQTLRGLEALISPTRNFYNLRAEMESGSDTGCIPFVGIYTHDLLFNAQRPSEIASSPTTAPLVNFERCRYAATIVKTLLRLLEASTLYQFQPVEGITERCLWMSALSDEEIRKHSHRLE
ncbi:RasGEF domain-containing protein [Colletotrichum higginsianum]|uniref:RasGEF domain-containing protein n=1 Tax=Colletotrichum higginsianum (strain IMI 349063) TaxID=759273 RepID=H1V6V2_COLHI|nr:RasGEF domain-containing protein [Colletotrichum higginsianum IMI 349063]OBR06798.1 RasGEF domain-containing protein [Colletotrichum higginsianum IMI 349063]CCF35954.1 RasGEF domain-containing protein [Colletotrichum higginsianum]